MKTTDRHLSTQELLQFADGELALRDAVRAKSHLASCWECRARLRQSENTISEIMDLHHRIFGPQLPPDAGPRALLKARLAEMNLPPAEHRWNRSTVALGVAAVILMMFTAGMLVARYTTASKTRRLQASAFGELVVPDRRLTPGAARFVSTSELCASQYSDDAREVPAETRQRVFQEYGMAGQSHNYELDYLISPELGGTDDISNLWPEPESAAGWNMQVKDALENRLHQMVCRGNISLTTAQKDLATDWISAYKKYFHTTQPLRPS
jgi:hypothetical protein